MDLDSPHGDDPEKFQSWLFARLREGLGPAYTWDESIRPIHTSFEEWQVSGTWRQTSTASLPSATPTSASSQHARHASWHKSYESKTQTISIVARISKYVLRMERQYNLARSKVAEADPKGRHHLLCLQLLRLPPKQTEDTTLAIMIQRAPGYNDLPSIVDCGPNWYMPVDEPRSPASPRAKTVDSPDIHTFLAFAIEAAECCEVMHQAAGLIHGELRPDCFHFDRRTGSVKLAYLGSGARSIEDSLTSSGWALLTKEHGIEHKLQFCAPEQTGRLGIQPNCSSDLYRLGVIFYNILTGEVPFHARSPMGILQCVLNQRIAPVSSKRDDVPDALCAVIQKLLSKNIDARYYSASGLKYDLTNIQRLLREGDIQGLSHFEIARKDVHSYFSLPEKVIGRDDERAKILAVFDRASSRTKEHTQRHQKRALSPLSSNSSMSEEPLDAGDAMRRNHSVSTNSSKRSESLGVHPPVDHHGRRDDSRYTLPSPKAETPDHHALPRRALDKRLSHDAASCLGNGSASVISEADSKSFTGSAVTATSAPVTDSGSLIRRTASTKYRKPQGKAEVISISGPAGIGKSSLVRSIQAPARQRGYFASAKFDQVNKAPFEPVLTALSSVFRQIFSETDVNTEFHQNLRTFVRPAFHLLASMLDLPTWLLDSAPPTNLPARTASTKLRKPGHGADASPTTGGNIGHNVDDYLRSRASSKSLRFSAVFLDVLRWLSAQRLICLSLEDVQHADDESADLLQAIIASHIPVVLILTRRTRVPMPAKMDAIINDTSRRARRTQMELQPLTEEHVAAFVEATLHRERSYIFPLVAVLAETSGGNPFYLREALELCYSKQCLWYSWEESFWTFDLDRVFTVFSSQSHGLRFNSDFILARLLDLPAPSRQLIAWASLLGESFSFALVKSLMTPSNGQETSSDTQTGHGSNPPHPRAELIRQSSYDAVRALEAAIAAFIVMPGEADETFCFQHKTYQQAAMMLPECKDVQEMHFSIARAMLRPELDVPTYVSASYICLGVDVIRRTVVRRAPYREILFQAAEKASQSGGKGVSLKYFTNALALLQPEGVRWSDGQEDVDYSETLLLHHRIAESYYMATRGADALRITEVIIAHARNAVDKAPAWILQSRIAAMRADHSTAVTLLKSCLSHLGIDLHTQTTWEQCDKQFYRLKTELEMIDLDSLVARPLGEHGRAMDAEPSDTSHPPVTNSSHARVPTQTTGVESSFLSAVGAVLCEATGAAFWMDPLLFFQLALLEVDINLHRGVVPQSALAYIHLATIAIGRFDMIELGHQLGELALRFIESPYSDSYTKGRGSVLHGKLLAYFSTPLQDTLLLHEESLEQSLSSGDTWSALLNVGITVATKLWCSHDLLDIENFCLYGADEVVSWKDDMRGGTFIVGVRQFSRCLQGKTRLTDDASILDDESFDASEFLEIQAVAGTRRSTCLFLFYKFWAHYLFGHYMTALRLCDEIHAEIEEAWSSRHVIAIPFYRSLCQLALLREDPSALDVDQVKDQVRACISKLENWSVINDATFAAWSSILTAELCEVEGSYGPCLASLEKALDHAEVQSMWLEYALALELYGEFMVRRGSKRAARTTIRDAVASYRRISALGKADQLAQKHEWLLQGTGSLHTADAGVQTDAPSVPDRTSWAPPSATSMPTREGPAVTDGLDIFDLESLLKSSQALSSTLQMDELFPKLTQIVLQTTAAELCAIIIEDEEIGWSPAAITDALGNEYASGQSLEKVENIVGKQIILYAIRFKELVFCNNIYDDVRFSNVPESYRQRNPYGRAIVAMPIERGDRLVGCLYVEGEPHSFAQRNSTVLSLLVNSIGISIANAQLFRSQQRALAQAREAEQKAKENLKLAEEAAKAKSMFLANVSHELRTPLHGTIGVAELLKGTDLDAEQDGYADSIRVCADTLLTVINDILDYSKLEAGKMQLFSVPLSLGDTVREVIRALSFSNTGKHVETIADLDSLPKRPLVMGDPVRLHQVLMNLLSNAYKFTTKGSVTVLARVEEDTDEYLVATLGVRDTGIGISEEQKRKLFQPFSQADSSTARSYGGTGLGLSICRAIIESVLKGRIWLDSKVGEGTTVLFTVKFPKAPADAPDPRAQSSSTRPTADPMALFSTLSMADAPDEFHHAPLEALRNTPRGQIRICIAEDNPVNQKIAIQFVQRLGFACQAYGDGQQAVDALVQAAHDQTPFHIVLMDVQMPKLDGYDATREIRRHADVKVREVLIIAMTASAIRGDREKCMEAGMNNYLAKPVRQAVLRDMLEGYLSGNAGKVPSLERDDGRKEEQQG